MAGSLKGSSSGSEEATSIIQFCPKLSGATILHAISNGQSCNFVKDLFIAFPRSAVNEALASNLDSFACLLAAVSLNSPALVRLLVEYGANPDAADDNGMPILAHSIINRSIYGTDIVKTLLALGANPHVIPSQLWINKTGRDEPHGIKPGAAWCNAMYQEVLKCFINIPVKYYLRRAAINGAFGSGPIKNKLPASFVGQEWAIQLVKDYLNAYNICKGNIPLILAFAGPPGHGKETLARALGDFHELSHVSCKKNSSSKQSNAASSFKGGLDVFFIDGDNVDRAWLKALFKRAISSKPGILCLSQNC